MIVVLSTGLSVSWFGERAVCLFVCLFVCLLACLLACLFWSVDECYFGKKINRFDHSIEITH